MIAERRRRLIWTWTEDGHWCGQLSGRRVWIGLGLGRQQLLELGRKFCPFESQTHWLYSYVLWFIRCISLTSYSSIWSYLIATSYLFPLQQHQFISSSSISIPFSAMSNHTFKNHSLIWEKILVGYLRFLSIVIVLFCNTFDLNF